MLRFPKEYDDRCFCNSLNVGDVVDGQYFCSVLKGVKLNYNTFTIV